MGQTLPMSARGVMQDYGGGMTHCATSRRQGNAALHQTWLEIVGRKGYLAL
jgi:hypothetical protein